MTQTTTFDVVIIGGGAAGSAAALQLGRIRRSVLVIDAGTPRNSPSPHMHGFPSQDGASPIEFQQACHAELEQYDIEVKTARVVGLSIEPDGTVSIDAKASQSPDTPATYKSRRVLLATGITDILPELPGIRDLWGDKVIHCPWCHGWELKDQPIAVLDTTGVGIHQALTVSQLSDEVTFISHLSAEISPEDKQMLTAAGVTIEPRSIQRIDERPDGVDVILDDGSSLAVAALMVGPQLEPNLSFAASLSLQTAELPKNLGYHLTVDETGRTNLDAFYAAGNLADPRQQVLHAAADGSRIAVAINADLHKTDLLLAASNQDQQG